jgi:ATP-dependent exoDNAse (exonuclease V) alpha subunit
MNTPKQDAFLEAVLAGKNAYLSGKAGTGKSYITRKAINDLKALGKEVIAVAPTGVAANNIGGQTIHSMFRVDPYEVCTYKGAQKVGSEKRKLYKRVDTIFVDEISMLRPDLLDCIHWTLMKNGVKDGLMEKQIIFIGDLKQLPAIIGDNFRSVMYQTYSGDEFFNAGIYPKLNVVEIELDEVMRQSNEEFVEHLNIIREGGKHEYFKRFLHPEAHGIILAPYNETVKAYNDRGLREQPGEIFEFTAQVEGNAKADEFNVESTIRVKHGCKIMYLANSKNNPLVNGTLGEFVVGENGNFFIKVAGVDYALDRHQFVKKEYVYNPGKDKLEMQEIGSIIQYPFRLAYALTIHKSQGLTFDKVTVDLSRPCFQPGQQYVALSRVTGPEGLRILVNR